MNDDSPMQTEDPARQPAKKPKGYSKVALSALFWSYFRGTLYTIIAIPTTVFLARVLTPREFGIAAAATFFGQLASNLASGGMATALIRVKDLRDEHVSSVFVFNLMLCLFTGFVLLGCSRAIGAFYGSPEVTSIMPLVAFDFFLTGIFTIPNALLNRDLRYKQLSAVGTCDLFVSSVLACLLAWLGFSYWSLVIAAVSGGLARGVLAMYFIGWRPSFRFSRPALAELFSFGMGSYGVKLLAHASLNIDNVVIGRVLGLSALGFYDKGFAVCNKVYKRLTAVGPGISFRIFSILQHEPTRFRRGYRKVILSSTMLTYPVFTGLIVVADSLFVVAFGERWMPAVLPFQIICVSFCFKLTSSYVGAAAQAHGHIWSQLWRQAAYTVLIAVNVYAFSGWGLNGAAFGVLLATFLGWMLAQQLLTSITILRWSDVLAPQVPAVTCSLGMIAVVKLLELALVRVNPDLSPWILLLSQTVTGTLYYLLFVWFSRFPELRALVNDTLSDVSPRLARLVRAS